MKKKYTYKEHTKVFKTDDITHSKVVAYCKFRGTKIYIWVNKILLAAIEKGI